DRCLAHSFPAILPEPMVRLRPLHAFVGVVSCATASAAVFAMAACTGDDPAYVPNTETDGASGDGSNTDSGEGDPGAPLLKLEADPLVVTAGSSDALRVRVVERRNVGEVAFRIQGAPEGVSLPSVAKLGETATSIDIPVSTLASARHGDFPITLAAEGQPFSASATVVVRGLAGTIDTGFGTDGTSVLLVSPGTDHRVVPLADGRVLVAWTGGGRPVVRIVDAKGQPVQPDVAVTEQGTLDGVAAFGDSSFVLAIRQASGVRLAWYTPTLAAGPSFVVDASSPTNVAHLASSPAGAILAQTRSVGGEFPTILQRYLATGAKDPAFGDVQVPAVEPGIRMVQGTKTGAAWLEAQQSAGTDNLAYAAAGSPPMIKRLGVNEVCTFGADLDEDIVTRCTGEDEPRRSVRRYLPDGGHRADFGTGGNLVGPAADNNGREIVSNRVDRLYVTRVPGGGFATEVYAFDGKGGTRSVFGNDGVLTIPGSDGKIVIAVDARGRLVAADQVYEDTTPALRIRRYWD
ncbi:MAG: hypothetical protein K0S65_5519, partial [Labilithrix sp.]|nr:hypothetical protein [Labilithrix sp.]